MSKPENTTPYFDLLQKISMDEPMEDILEELRAAMKDHRYEFSLVSKMRHTRDPRLPIYDSKVRAYLSKEEGISFWWHHTGAPRGTGEMEKIMHDWKALCNWYQAFMMSERGKSWIEWFDACFPNDRGISNVKKIDFIIFATGE